MIVPRFALVVALAIGAAGCLPRANPYAGLPTDVVDRAARKASVTPSPISTLEFKELGDTRRFATMQQLVARTWGETCQVVSAVPRTYSPRGDSIWNVKCAGGPLPFDYSISLPERRAGGARVLQCFAGRPGQTICNTLGRAA